MVLAASQVPCGQPRPRPIPPGGAGRSGRRQGSVGCGGRDGAAERGCSHTEARGRAGHTGREGETRKPGDARGTRNGRGRPRAAALLVRTAEGRAGPAAVPLPGGCGPGRPDGPGGPLCPGAASCFTGSERRLVRAFSSVVSQMAGPWPHKPE